MTACLPDIEGAQNRQPEPEHITLLQELDRRGVTLWSEAGQLRYRAPKGALTSVDVARLSTAKQRLIAFLEARERPAQARDAELAHVPLAYSQLAHWNLYGLAQRPAIRQIAAALRMHGQLDLRALRLSIAAIVRQHDALRTRIVLIDEMPVQQIAGKGKFELSLDDLSQLPSAQQAAQVASSIEQQILQPVDVARDPLFTARLIQVGGDEHVLILAMEHMISDLYSLKLLIRDLRAAYSQASSSQPIVLPPIGLQFSEYASRQRAGHDSWIAQHGAYWGERLASWRRLRFPADAVAGSTAGEGRCHVPVRIDRRTKERLLELAQRQRTTLVMTVLTAYAALVLRWCDVREGVVQCQSDGRMDPSVENTIGYFAAALYLHVGLSPHDTWIDLLERVRQEYCEAYQHADFSYFAAQTPRHDFTLSTQFNWVPQGADFSAAPSAAPRPKIEWSPMPFVHPLLKRVELDIEPSILLFDSDDGIVGDLYFPPHRHSEPMMRRFLENLQTMIAALRDEPKRRVLDVELA